MKDEMHGDWVTKNEESVVMGKFEVFFDLVTPVKMDVTAENYEMVEEFMNNLSQRLISEATQFLKTIDGSVHKVHLISDTEIDVKEIEEIEDIKNATDLLGKNSDK